MDLEKVAIMRLRDGAEISKRYYDKPLMLCYSGGKDSDIILNLAIKSGIDFLKLNIVTQRLMLPKQFTTYAINLRSWNLKE